MKTLQQIETEIEAILCDPSVSYWLKNQLRARTDRDPPRLCGRGASVVQHLTQPRAPF